MSDVNTPSVMGAKLDTGSHLSQAALVGKMTEHKEAEARNMIAVIQALLDSRLGMHEVDLDALTAKVAAVNDLLDGDEQSEGFQKFAALTTKLANAELKGNQNAAAITALRNALNGEIAALGDRVDTVENEARTGREALDARITQLRSEYEAHVAKKLAEDNQRNTRLDDVTLRIGALEASKKLTEGRLAELESDRDQVKSDVLQIKTTLQAQAEGLQAELERAQAVEAELRTELETERSRLDGVVTKQGTFATRQDVANASEAASMAAVSAMWDEAGIPMPAGLPMPDGSVSQ